MKFRKKPVVIDAVQWDGHNLTEVAALGAAREYEQDFLSGHLIIHTLEGDMRADKGDWIIKGIKGIKGELYPCRPDIFAATYEPWLGNPAYQSNHLNNVDGSCNMGYC
jgi:hypothetical protein